MRYRRKTIGILANERRKREQQEGWGGQKNPHLYILSPLSLHMSFLKSFRKRRPPTLKKTLSKAMHCSRRKIYVSDPHFDPISNKAMSEFLVFDNTNFKEWKEDIWDCDDFSLQFKAAAQRYFAIRDLNPAVGIIWTDKHAFNFYLNPKMEVHFIEPQSDAKTFLMDRVKLVMI